MTIATTSSFLEQAQIVTGLAPVVPSSSTPKYVNTKGYDRVLVLIKVQNGTTVTGSAITLKQATDVSGTGEKALAFTTRYQVIGSDTNERFLPVTVTSNTFTPPTTNSTNYLEVIEVLASSLDVANGFRCLRVGTADATAQTVSVDYIMWGTKYMQAGERPVLAARVD